MNIIAYIFSAVLIISFASVSQDPTIIKVALILAIVIIVLGFLSNHWQKKEE